ncbi:acyl-CoA dehydrogenase family protein [Amycolatopsis sp. GM8]|uniref:acyl-CoA dehydrogenase family protein n=1 Tax=Amycolatopsis sp. GM8 TaxID=2896530 RepID=UPI001F18DD20|nr:acyl-CoA dehydrogenase family protein [Amycolatopsis sp. GM8]
MSETTISTGDPELVALVRTLNQDLAEENSPFNSELWSAMSDAELQLIGIPEDDGGPGGTLSDLVATVFECARAAAAIPLVENWLAQYLRAKAGLGIRPGVSICVGPAELGRTALSIDGLTWAPHADELLVIEGSEQASAVRPVTSWIADATTRYDLAGQPAQDVEIPLEGLGEPGPVAHGEFVTVTNLLRAAQLGGAIRGCFDLTRGYAAERHQFGVRIDSFPAVQQHLIQLAQAAAITRVSVFRAAAATEATQAARAARLVSNEFARVAIRCAHQVHGAIGMTREYHLASLTQRLHWWRQADAHLAAKPHEGQTMFIDDVWLDTAEAAQR